MTMDDLLAKLTTLVGAVRAQVERLVPDGERRAIPLAPRITEGAVGEAAGAPRYALADGPSRRHARPSLPDPKLIDRIIRQRRLRERYFEPHLFADPAWDILLELTAARLEHRQLSVTALCYVAAVPSTTALRWVNEMTRMGLVTREDDPLDGRRALVSLSDSAARSIAAYFDEIGTGASRYA